MQLTVFPTIDCVLILNKPDMIGYKPLLDLILQQLYKIYTHLVSLSAFMEKDHTFLFRIIITIDTWW